MSSRTSTISLSGTTLNEAPITPYYLPTSNRSTRHQLAKKPVDQCPILSEEGRILIRLHFHPHNELLISVDLPIMYEDLMERIAKKAKLCLGCEWQKRKDYPTVSYTDINGREQVITPESDLASIFNRGSPTPLYPVTVLHVC
ncbi:hypothetical protein VKT23_014799 [Stygiomarasmius scandens]|uniref:PB1 domain-containing protein n=1 Tax=Marasmiellus scandens TaxID=2682957 RepID=A0ABR1IZ85_9AGAR